jgi:hypothetical protein
MHSIICKIYSTICGPTPSPHTNFIPFSICHKKKIHKHSPHTNRCCFPIVGVVVILLY